MTTSTPDCNFILTATEVGIEYHRAVPATLCRSAAVCKIGEALYRCKSHYVDLLAAKPIIDWLSMKHGYAAWKEMDVEVFG